MVLISLENIQINRKDKTQSLLLRNIRIKELLSALFKLCMVIHRMLKPIKPIFR